MSRLGFTVKVAGSETRRIEVRARRILTLLGVLGVLLVTAPAARAAVRYADPASSTATGSCGASTPCAVKYAIEGAASDDEVVVRPGDYGSTAAPMTSAITASAGRLDVHGQTGQPRPRLFFSTPAFALQLNSRGSVSDLEIVNPAGQGLYMNDGDAGPAPLAERVVVKAGGATGFACYIRYGTLRDSVCLSDGAGGKGAGLNVGAIPGKTYTMTIRNVTAIATGTDSVGILAGAGNDAQTVVTARNSIARGTAFDVKASHGGGGSGAGTVKIGYSNFVTRFQSGFSQVQESPAGSNQSSAPLFANAALGDYRQLVGSPTIDAGEQNPLNGPFDLDRGPRTAGASTDIGADEFDPPPSPPPPPAPPSPSPPAKPGKLSKLKLKAPGQVRSGRKFKVRIKIRNTGGTNLTNVRICLKTQKKFIKGRGRRCRVLSNLAAGKTRAVKFKLKSRRFKRRKKTRLGAVVSKKGQVLRRHHVTVLK